MGQGSILNRGVAIVILVLATALDEGHFVVPPHDVAPVRLIVFFKLSIELKILSDAHDDVVWGDTWVCLIAALIPLALAEMEGTHTKCHVNDGTFFSCLVFNFNSSQLGILISRHEENSALR